MKHQQTIGKEEFVRLLEETPFEHLTSSVHVMDLDSAEEHYLAGVSLYSNRTGWTAQINWLAVVGSENVTIRVGDADQGEPAYEIRDQDRNPLRVVDGNMFVSEDEMANIVAKSALAQVWEQDAVDVLRESAGHQATLH